MCPRPGGGLTGRGAASTSAAVTQPKRDVYAITGASGLVGTALTEHLRAEGHEVRRFVRGGGASPAPGGIAWDPIAGTVDSAALEGTSVVVNLAGETVVGLWTEAKKARIRESRVRSTEVLAKALAALGTRPRVLVSASAIGFYPDVGADTLDETAAPGAGFLSEVCRAWEGATREAEAAGIRVVHLRIGVVFTGRGGALSKMALPFRLGAGGRIGSGKQYMSWIDLADLLRAITFVANHEDLRGPVNAVGPSPVTNAELTRALGEVLHRPTLFPAPAAVVRAALGEFSTEVLSSHRIAPKKLLDAGFTFTRGDLGDSLRRALR